MQHFPERVVIGADTGSRLVFLERGYAHAAASELAEWESATTWGDALLLARRDGSVLGSPVHPDDASGHEADAEFSVAECGAVEDGDWPRDPAAVALDYVDGSWSLGRVSDTVLNGSVLEIPLDQESALIAELEKRGVTWTRDDDLVRRAGWLTGQV